MITCYRMVKICSQLHKLPITALIVMRPSVVWWCGVFFTDNNITLGGIRLT
jgi:hypothetical protein